MNYQEVFNKVAKHLLTQKVKSMIGKDCAYRAEVNGKQVKCALGVLIPDSEYHSAMEGGTATRFTKFFCRLGYTDLAFLTDLQMLHDCHSPSTWATQLRKLAKRYDLNTNIVKGVK